jgi:hypothetical protein
VGPVRLIDNSAALDLDLAVAVAAAAAVAVDVAVHQAAAQDRQLERIG